MGVEADELVLLRLLVPLFDVPVDPMDERVAYLGVEQVDDIL